MSIAAPATNPASDLELKLPATIGTAGQVLKNSSTPGTLEFGDAVGGKIAQVIKGDMISEGQWSTTSDSYVDITGLTVAITLSASNSKVLITSNITSNLVYGQGGTIKNQTKLIRGTTDLQEIGDYAAYAVGNGETDSLGVAGFHQYLDTPGAGTHTYKWQIKQTAGGGTTWIQASSSMVAWEILQ
jgi:hypothetical protein